MGHELGHLRDREDEHEVEEELEARNTLFALGASITHHEELVERGTSLIVVARASGPTMGVT